MKAYFSCKYGSYVEYIFSRDIKSNQFAMVSFD